MQINNKISSNNFGWHIKTHAQVTEKALSNFPKLLPYKKYFTIGSQIPDISLQQTSALDKVAHNFYGDPDEALSMDALEFFQKLYGDTLFFLSSEINGYAAFKGGQALHFLQDMGVPLHTQKKYQSPFRIFSHIKYEGVARKHPEYIDSLVLDRSKLTPQPSSISYTDRFFDAYEKSAKMPHPFDKENRGNWDKSVKEALENTYHSTCEFLANFEDKIRR